MTTITNPSFESGLTGWTNASTGSGSVGIQTDYFTNGVQGAYLDLSGIGGGQAELNQNINIDSDFNLVIDFKFTTTDSNLRFTVAIGTTSKYNILADSGTHADVSIPITGYSGTQQLRFIFEYIGSPTNGRVNLDNLRITSQTFVDVYVNSSTGNDSNVGDSCTAGHPVQTFTKAYSYCKSDGSSTIHVCNSGADFSVETVTFNKGFSITTNASTGNFFMPKFT